jgi:hypothetical protein
MAMSRVYEKLAHGLTVWGESFYKMSEWMMS